MPHSLLPRSLGPAQRRESARRPDNQRLPTLYRLPADPTTPRLTDPLARDPQLAAIEAALFLADEPLTPRKLAQVCRLSDNAAARQLVTRLQELYDADGSAFQVEEVAGGFQLLTRPEYHRWLVRLRQTGNELRLTPAMKETLAIVAYKQPIVRADIEAIRGVHCGEVLRQLMEKGLVRITGRDDSLGRPVLYGTAKKFLQVYGLKSLKELPQVSDLMPPKEKPN